VRGNDADFNDPSIEIRNLATDKSNSPKVSSVILTQRDPVALL
jgi:hypothetical protein